MQALRGAAAFALIALAGCATTPPPASVPTNIKSGQSWVITRQGIAEQVLDTCSRDSPARHPTRSPATGRRASNRSNSSNPGRMH